MAKKKKKKTASFNLNSQTQFTKTHLENVEIEFSCVDAVMG